MKRANRTYVNGDELEAVPRPPIFSQRLLVFEHKSNLDNAGDASRHESVTKHFVRSGASHKLLRMGRHSPASDQDNKAWNEVALGIAVAIPAKPYTRQAGAPPDNAHSSVLPIILDPSGAPAVLSKCVDATPHGDHSTVEEFLRTPRLAHPYLPCEKSDGKENAVCDEGTSHDEVRSALADVFALTET